jgi:hypothetical protein
MTFADIPYCTDSFTRRVDLGVVFPPLLAESLILLRKEVIQPHLPVRLPCSYYSLSFEVYGLYLHP